MGVEVGHGARKYRPRALDRRVLAGDERVHHCSERRGLRAFRVAGQGILRFIDTA
jgi:hypothetical protein